MRLGLHVLPKTVDQYLRDLGAIVDMPTTLVFLDTNILGYLYKLHAAARKEFFDWTIELDLVDGRIFLPAWSANEYLAKFKSGKFSEYGPSRPEQAIESLNALWETASLFVDDDNVKKVGYVGPGARDKFLDGFDAAIKELSRFTSVFSHQFDVWSVHSEITYHLSDCVLYSDLAKLCAQAASDGEARISHRLPPGYRDSAKPENKFGDLIIWFEILEHARKTAADKSKSGATTNWHVVFLTNDEKSDWVYAPAKRLFDTKGVIKEVTNVEPMIKLPDARLVAEFHSVVGHGNIHIVTLPMLIRALSMVRPKDFESLASAIQIEFSSRPEIVESLVDEETDSSAESSSQPAELEVEEMELSTQTDVGTLPKKEEVAPPAVDSKGSLSQGADDIPLEPQKTNAFTYPPDALRDGAYEVDAPGVINEVIRELRSHNWYTQNPAIQKIRGFRQEQFEPKAWFVLGRNIYQAACGNAQRALEFIRNLDIELSRFPPETANHVLCGMVFEVFFDRHGNFRQRPKASHIEQIMREISNDRFAQSKNVLVTQLAPYTEWVPFLPGDTALVPLVIDAAEAISAAAEGTEKTSFAIKSVIFLGAERLQESGDQNVSVWSTSSFGGSISPKQIKSELSDNYAIPEWAIRIELSIPSDVDTKLVIPEGKRLNLDRPTLVAPN